MNRKRILQKNHFRLTWTREDWEWRQFMALAVENKMEGRIWHGVDSFNEEWLAFLRKWMMLDGHFFVGRFGGGRIVGACWVTDVADGVGKFHLAVFHGNGSLIKRVARDCISRIIAFGLDGGRLPCYQSLVGETPFEGAARLATSYGLADDIEKVEGYFDGAPGYRVRIKPKEYSHGWRRRSTEAAVTAEATAAPGPASDQGEQGRGARGDGRTRAAGPSEGSEEDPDGAVGREGLGQEDRAGVGQ